MSVIGDVGSALVVWPALLWLAWWLGERWHAYGLPRVSAYVAIGAMGGALGGSTALGLAQGGGALLAQLALALVLFELGCRLHLGWFRRNPWLLAAGIGQSLLVFMALYAGLGWLGLGEPWRPLLAAAATAASPAALLRVANDARAAGQVTERMLHLAALQTVLAVLLFKLATAYWFLSAEGDWLQAGLTSLYTVSLSVALGVALAVGMSQLMRGAYPSSAVPTVGYALALVWLTVVADALRLSPLLAALSFGALLRERLAWLPHAQRDFGTLGLSLGVFLFVYVGARTSWAALADSTVWLVAALIVAVRLGLPAMLNAALAVLSGTTVRKGALTGVALLPMSAVTLVLLERGAAQGLTPAPPALWHATAALFVLELLGPVLTLWALRAAREAVGGVARRAATTTPVGGVSAQPAADTVASPPSGAANAARPPGS
ncbi:cation:proton antiporter domain-containing protein [Tepidimonas sp.]|uniref:cation:proton antiporter domain-containing protein n=1 Tax=Tepidimonas sp. TaxID=2002775 RepID=UPI002FE0280F